jgi:hypothetical protein
MALIFTEGFDFLNALLARGKGWVEDPTGLTMGQVVTRYSFGNSATGESSYKDIGGSRTTVITGVGFTVVNFAAAATRTLIRFSESSTVHVSVGLNSTGNLAVWNGNGTTLLATGPAITVNAGSPVWYYVDVEVTVSDTVGVVKVWLDDTLVINLSGADTRNGGTGIINPMAYGRTAANITYYIDDIYCLDATGTTNNAKIGTCRIETLLPNADSSTAWTRNTGATNFSAVDDTSTDGDTTYVVSYGTNARDIYGCTDVSSTSRAVRAVTATAISRKEDVGAANLRVITQIGATVFTGNTVYMDSNLDYVYNLVQQTWENSPSTGIAWTGTQVNGALFGIERL